MKGSWIILLFIFWTPANGQVLSDWETRSENFYNRIKNIEFFIDRFNHQPEGSGKVVEVNKQDTITYLHWLKERDAVIFTLFEKQRIQMEKESYISKDNFNNFIRQVNNPFHEEFIHFADSGWYAALTFEATYHKKPVAIECALKVNRSKEGVYTWSITSLFSKH